MNTARVGVMIPNYNNERFVSEAIRSILDQTYTDWHLYISDDGSTDQSGVEIQNTIDHSGKKDQITYIKHTENIGNPANRNVLLEHAKRHELLAILDSDDVAIPNRLEQQVVFFDNNKEVGLVGSFIEIINEEGVSQGIRTYPTKHHSIKQKLLVFDPFAQPSVMFRSEALQKVAGYDESLLRCQDYDLFIRMIQSGVIAENISEPLIQFRIFSNQGKYQKISNAFLYSFKVRSKYLFSKEFFTAKGFVMWIGYGGAFLVSKILPAQVFSYIFNKLFVKTS